MGVCVVSAARTYEAECVQNITRTSISTWPVQRSSYWQWVCSRSDTVMETSMQPVSRVFTWRLLSESSRFFQLRRKKLNKGSYGDTDGQLITLLFGFRVTSAERKQGVHIVNVTNYRSVYRRLCRQYIGTYTFSPYTYFRPMRMSAYC